MSTVATLAAFAFLAVSFLAFAGMVVCLVLASRARAAAGAPAIAAVVAAPEPRPEPEQERSTRAPRVSARGRIMWVSGPLVGTATSFDDGGVWIGRGAEAALVIDLPSISKLHVWVGPQEGEVVAVDDRSSNGTFVNGARIGRHVLQPGDVVTLADAAARFRFEKW